MKHLSLLLLGASALALVACGETTDTTAKDGTHADHADHKADAKADNAPSYTAEEMAAEDARLKDYLDAEFQAGLMRSPTFQTYLGMKGDDYDKWDEFGDAAADEEMALTVASLEKMRADFDRSKLSKEGQLNYDLYENTIEGQIKLHEFQDHQFAFSQFSGMHTQIPVFLANFHRVDDYDDAMAYLRRVQGVDGVLGPLADQAENRAAMGYTLPEFSYPKIVEASGNVIKGYPFDGDKETPSPVYRDFMAKIDALHKPGEGKEPVITDEQHEYLSTAIEASLQKNLKPAYEKFIRRVEAIGADVKGNYGVGYAGGPKNGAAYYDALLADYTTTTMTAEEVHQTGLDEVARIHAEMEAIMEQVGFEGTLQEFFEFMRVDEQFYYKNTAEDREKYLEDARYYIGLMTPKLDDMFITKPKSDVIVKRVEEFRENSAGKAFYNAPSLDGSRPGIFYANLKDMADMPTYQLEALVYHEAVPGHHMQIAIQQELRGVPQFRQFARYTAYSEGWGLYSEYLGKDVGLYEDPYSDFGRLAMELWRAARLVVDTGLHSKGWEMNVAIDYLKENTPNPAGDCEAAIQRYIVYPGQATAYKIGMLKIQELRAKAETELGDKFSLAEFHETILVGGAVPLSILEKKVDDYIASAK